MRTYNLVAVVSLVAACAAPTHSVSTPSASRASTEAVTAMVRGDYAAALAIADRGLAKWPGDPWLLYNRGASLAALGHVDQALETLRASERAFGDAESRALAAYRRALTLEFAGRCAEASTELSHYAALMRATDATLADEAMAHVKFCVSPTPQQLAERDEAARLARTMSNPAIRAAEEASTEAVRALSVLDYAHALQVVNTALDFAPDDPWLIYNKGTALAGLGRLDESLEWLRAAELSFSAENLHGRSIATYRRAIALEVAGRCDEAGAELTHYAQLMNETQPLLAQHALTHIKFCRLANGKKETM